jgi:nitroreductase
MVSDLLKLISKRYSCRKFSCQPVENEIIEQLLESARLAPSASNSQPWFYYVVKNKEKVSKIAKSMPFNSSAVINKFIEQAPIIMVACKQPTNMLHRLVGTLIQKDWREIDVAIATEHMALMATELGLGSCWIGWYDEEKIKKICGIEKKHKVVALLALGYPDSKDNQPNKSRKPLAEMAKFC